MQQPNRPDFSNYLAHFTAKRAPFSRSTDNPTAHVKGMQPYDRIVSMLNGKKILASRLPWNNRNAICLTECPWSSLLSHAKTYSPYGIGFTKEFIFNKGGAPAFYVRPDLFEKQQWNNEVLTFTTPFWPPYRNAALRTNGKLGNKNVDYSHEREWRVPEDMDFAYTDIAFVVLNTYEDMASFPKPLKDAIGRDKFLLMQNYKNIENLWPFLKVET